MLSVFAPSPPACGGRGLGRGGPSDHIFRSYPLVELLRGDMAELHSRLLERGAFLGGFLRDLRGLVVADARIERRNQPQGLPQTFFDAFAIRFEPGRAMAVEARRAAGRRP